MSAFITMLRLAQSERWSTPDLNDNKRFIFSVLSEVCYAAPGRRELRRSGRTNSLVGQQVAKTIQSYVSTHRRFRQEIENLAAEFEYEIEFIEGHLVVATIMRSNDLCLIAFRGTANAYDLSLDAMCWRTIGSSVHAGFQIAALEEQAEVVQRIGDHRTVFLTGHSLGAAIAAITPEIITALIGPRTIVASVFACPRISDRPCPLVAAKMESFAFKDDLVPSLPSLALGYMDQPYERIIDAAGLPSNAAKMPDRRALFAIPRSKYHALHAIERYRNAMGARINQAPAQLF